jgi:hypothetical protein
MVSPTVSVAGRSLSRTPLRLTFTLSRRLSTPIAIEQYGQRNWMKSQLTGVIDDFACSLSNKAELLGIRSTFALRDFTREELMQPTRFLNRS